jgi:RNA polymerase sigma-54 factor
MRFDTSQSMRLGQHMKLAPRMIQSMEILQMPAAELEERIEQELEGNITLELAESRGDRQSIESQQAQAERDATENERPLDLSTPGQDDFERLESFEAANPDLAVNEYSDRAASRNEEFEPTYNRARLDGERDAKSDAMAATPARSVSLHDQLLEQWHLTDVDRSLRAPGDLIISFLDDDGYLRTPLEVIADRAPAAENGAVRPGLEMLENALDALQQALDPPGVAARNVRECLLLQIAALERENAASDPGRQDESLEIARWLVEDHLDDLMQNRLPKIAAATGLSIEEIKSGLERIKRLSPAPARRLVDNSSPPIKPDAIVEYDEENDRYIAFLADGRMPNLQINRAYAQMAKDRAVPKKDRDFLKTNLSNAQWLIDAVNQRKHTLLRVVNVVVQAQRDFFDYGPQALKPLPMTQVAEQLGIHVATVSRAVADKYLQTPRGIVPLRSFFTGGLATESGEDMSYDAVKAALREVVDAEDKTHPLSDEALVDELKKRGIEIARRTVAKYRDQLGIQSARLRKAF